MALITLERAAKFYGAKPVFTDVTFSINEGDRVGLVGVNGGGKSTLVAALCGELELDQGERRARRGLEIGLLAQMSETDHERTAREEALRGAEKARRLEAELRGLEAEMERGGDAEAMTGLAGRHAEVRERFERAGGEGYQRFTERALAGLGLPAACWDRPVRTLSSGQRIRVQLARLLQGQHDLMLLDEPTNHLDVDGIAWLADHLAGRSGALLVVSHDRWFLDRVANRVVEIAEGRVHLHPGRFSDYLPLREQKRLTALRAWEKQDAMIRRNEEFVRRAAHGNKPGVAQSRKRMLEKVERLEKPGETAVIRIRLGADPGGGRELIAGREVAFAHVGREPLFTQLSVHVSRGDRIGVVGPNGSGKTTLLKILAGRIAPTGGEVWRSPKLSIGYFDQDLSGLHGGNSALAEILATDPEMTEGQARGRLGTMGIVGDEVFRSISTFSGGEQGRIALLTTILAGGNVLFLDEPTNHLDVFTRQSFLEALRAFEGTVVMVTHDRYLLDAWASRVVCVDGKDTVVRDGNYAEFRAWQDARRRPEGEAARPAGKTARRKAAEAERRAAAADRPKKKRRFWKLEDLEAAIMEKEERLAEVEAAFADPRTARDRERLGRVLAESGALKAELAELNEEWETWA